MNESTVYVCPQRDIECGRNAASWCAICPQRAALQQRQAPAQADRAQFDDLAKCQGMNIERGFKDGYRDADTRAAWRGFQMCAELTQQAEAAPVASAEPVTYLRWWASQTDEGHGNIGHNEWYEVCEAHDRSIDGTLAFPVYAEPVVAQATPAPADELRSAMLELVSTQRQLIDANAELAMIRLAAPVASQPAQSEQMTNGMNDAALISYCETHCTTERALFNAEQVNRMIHLAGYPDGCVREVTGWMSIHDNMTELCKLARARLAAPVASQPTEGKDER